MSYKFKKLFRALILNPLEGILILVLFGVVKLIGYDLASKTLGTLARTLGMYVKRPTAVARKNLKRVFTNKSEDEIDTIIKGVWENLGLIVADFAFFNEIDVNDPNRFEIVNRHIPQAIKDNKQPAIFFSGHFANWVCVSIATSQIGIPAKQLYRRFNSPIFNWLVDTLQKSAGLRSILKGSNGAKDALKTLRSGESVVLYLDQKLNEGIPVPLLGKDAMTAPAFARLAQKIDCPMIPVQIIRTKSRKFKVIYNEPLVLPNTGDVHKDTFETMKLVNQHFDKWILENPEQWLWVHNRWPKDG